MEIISYSNNSSNEISKWHESSAQNQRKMKTKSLIMFSLSINESDFIGKFHPKVEKCLSFRTRCGLELNRIDANAMYYVGNNHGKTP